MTSTDRNDTPAAEAAGDPWTRVANPRRTTLDEDQVTVRAEGGLDGHEDATRHLAA